MEQKAKVLKLENKTTSAGNNIQEVVIEWPEQMNNGTTIAKHFQLTVFGEKVASLNLKVGEEATFFFDINARESNGRWYNSANLWRVDRGTSAPAPQPTAQPSSDLQW